MQHGQLSIVPGPQISFCLTVTKRTAQHSLRVDVATSRARYPIARGPRSVAHGAVCTGMETDAVQSADLPNRRIVFRRARSSGILVQLLHGNLSRVGDVAVCCRTRVCRMQRLFGLVVNSGKEMCIRWIPKARVDLKHPHLNVGGVLHSGELLLAMVPSQVTPLTVREQMYRTKHLHAMLVFCGLLSVWIVVDQERL